MCECERKGGREGGGREGGKINYETYAQICFAKCKLLTRDPQLMSPPEVPSERG